MRLVAAPLLALLAIAACGKPVCETYADMEWKCGNYPANEKDITMTLAHAACTTGASSPRPADREAMAIYAQEGECAKEHSDDCAAYHACKERLREATRRAAR